MRELTVGSLFTGIGGDPLPSAAAVRDALLRASVILAVNGWCRHFSMDGDKRCMSEALRDATFPELGLLHLAARTALQQVTGESITAFNDADGMTRRDAIAALRIAADLVV